MESQAVFQAKKVSIELLPSSVEVSTLAGSVLVWVDANSNRVIARAKGDYNRVKVYWLLRHHS